MNIRNVEKNIQAGGTISGLAKKYIFDKVTEASIEFVKGGDSLLQLQELKNIMKAEKANPFNMNMTKGHSNAKVRFWCLQLVSKGWLAVNGAAKERQKLLAIDVNGKVVYFNPQAVRHYIATVKDAKVKAKLTDELKKVLDLPLKESYY